MFRKTEILLKKKFKIVDDRNCGSGVFKSDWYGATPNNKFSCKKKKIYITFWRNCREVPWSLRYSYLSYNFFFCTTLPTNPFLHFFFFCFSSSTLLIDDQPTLSLDSELNTRKWSFFFFSETGYLNREILPRLRTRHHDILCMISYLCLLNYST